MAVLSIQDRGGRPGAAVAWGARRAATPTPGAFAESPTGGEGPPRGPPPSRLRQNLTAAKRYERVVDGMVRHGQNKEVRSLAAEVIPMREDGMHATLNKRYAQWRRFGLPAGATHDDAIARLESINRSHDIVLRYKIIFKDGSQVMFRREDIVNRETLGCTGFYAPRTLDDLNKTHQPKVVKPVVAKHRPLTDYNGRWFTPTYKKPVFDKLSYSGSASYAFTPVGYIAHTVRQNVNRPGLRPGLRETSVGSTQFRPRRDFPTSTVTRWPRRAQTPGP